MLQRINKRQVAWVLILAGLHALLSVALWLWMWGLTGLGFKDREQWATIQHVQVIVIYYLAMTFTFPARLLLDSEVLEQAVNGFVLFLALPANGLLVTIGVLCRRRRNAT